MLEKSDIILKHPSPFSIESLLGKTGEEGPCVSVSPPALQSPFMFPQLVPPSRVRQLAPHHQTSNLSPDLFSPQNFPFDLLARGLYQNMTGLIGELGCSPPDLGSHLMILPRIQQLNVWKVPAAQDSLHQPPASRGRNKRFILSFII